MADNDLYRDEELGARIELLSVPPEPEAFWSELRTAMDKPSREVQADQPRRPKRSRKELAMVGCLAAAGLITGGIIAKHVRPTGGGQPSCAMVVVWNQHRYSGEGQNQTFQRGASLGRVSIPDCGSAPGVPPGQQPPMAFAIKGIPTSRQIAVAGFPGVRFVRAPDG